MKYSHDELVRTRLRKGDDFDKFRKKVFDFRKLVAGDTSVTSYAPGELEPDGPVNGVRSSTEIYDFIVTGYQEGRSNKLLQQIKTLLQQTAYMFPEIEFEDLTPQEAALNAQYCKIRLGEAPKGCNAKDHLRLSLLDYMIGGIGWAKACLKNDQPILMHCDSLDMTWDRSVPLPCDIKWASCKVRQPLREWAEMFGKKAFTSEYASKDPAIDDQLIELEWYYDTDGGPEGSWYVYRSDSGDGVLGEPVHKGPNPYYFLDSGRKIPYVPYEAIYYMAIPSLRVPIGIVEMMLPNQYAVWDAEQNIKTTIDRGAPAYVISKEAMSEEALQEMLDGEIGSIIQVEHNTDQVQRLAGLDVSPTVMRWQQYNENEITGHSGANPYAVGQRVEGIEFASEVNAIQGNAGLVAGTIGKDLAAFWERAVKKFLGVGSLYDDLDIRLRIEEAVLRFDAYDPIKQYLRPDADLTISENTMQFRPKQEKIQEALADLQVAMSVAAQFPEAVKRSYTNYLRAKGEKNIDAWLQPAPQQVAEMGNQLSQPPIQGQEIPQQAA